MLISPSRALKRFKTVVLKVTLKCYFKRSDKCLCFSSCPLLHAVEGPLDNGYKKCKKCADIFSLKLVWDKLPSVKIVWPGILHSKWLKASVLHNKMRDMKRHACECSLRSLSKEKLVSVSTVATKLRQRCKNSFYLLHGWASLTIVLFEI